MGGSIFDRVPSPSPHEADWAQSVYHLYVIRTPRRDSLKAFLRDRGIETGIHYPLPCHRQPAVSHLPPVTLPRTEALVGEILSLPIFPDLDDASVDTVVRSIREFVGS